MALCNVGGTFEGLCVGHFETTAINILDGIGCLIAIYVK